VDCGCLSLRGLLRGWSRSGIRGASNLNVFGACGFILGLHRALKRLRFRQLLFGVQQTPGFNRRPGQYGSHHDEEGPKLCLRVHNSDLSIDTKGRGVNRENQSPCGDWRLPGCSLWPLRRCGPASSRTITTGEKSSAGKATRPAERQDQFLPTIALGRRSQV